MMDGLVIRRGQAFLARKQAKTARLEEDGFYWSTEIQDARVYRDFDSACRTATRCGGRVLIKKNGKAEE